MSFTLREAEVLPKNPDSDFSFVVSFRTFSCNTCKCLVISLVHWLTMEILLTIIIVLYRSKVSLGIQQRLKSQGFSTKFYKGRLCPEVQPLTLLYTISGRKGTPSYTFCWKWYLFHMRSLELCIPLNCCKCTVKIWINLKTRPYTQLFSRPWNASVSPFYAFLPTEMTVFPVLSYTSTSEIPTLSYT